MSEINPVTPLTKKDKENYEPEKSAVNLENMKLTDEAKASLSKASKAMRDELQNKKTLTHEEVIEKAREAEIITQGVSREATLEFQASLLKTRQHLAALAEQNELTPEFLDTLKVMSNLGTDIARNLESFKIRNHGNPLTVILWVLFNGVIHRRVDRVSEDHDVSNAG